MPGRYSGAGFSAIQFPGKYFNITSTAGAQATTIDGGALDRIFNFAAGEAGNLDGFTLQNGASGAGGCVLLSGSNFNFANSIIQNCQAVSVPGNTGTGSLFTTSGGAVYITQSTSQFSNITFQNNYAATGGGTIWLDTQANATFSNCRFFNEQAASFGGSVVPESDSNSRFYYCIFKGCTSKFGGSIDTGSSTTTEFWYTDIINSSAERGGAVYHFNHDNIKFYHSRFINNTAETSGGAVAVSVSSSPVYVNCTFDSNASAGGTGGAIYMEATSALSISNSRISNSIASAGGAFFGRGTTIATMSNVTIHHNSVTTYGGAILLEDGASVTMTNSSCYNNQAAMEAGCFKASNSASVTIVNSTIYNNLANSDGGGGQFEHNVVVTINNTIVQNNTAVNAGGGLLFTGSSFALLSGTSLVSNSALQKGGGIAATAIADIDLYDCTFTNNNGVLGGGIYSVSKSPIYVGQNSSLVGNTAQFGGAMFFDGGGSTTNQIEYSTIAYNNATAGGVFFYNVWARLAVFNNLTLIGNAANYGVLEATTPYQMVLNTPPLASSYSPKDHFSIGLRLIDFFNNTATDTIQQVIAQIQGLNGLYVNSFINRQAFEQGVITFESLSVAGALGTTYPLQISATSLPTLQWNVTIVSCGIGFTPTSLSTSSMYQCAQCSATTYSLVADQQCIRCPSGANCPGGSNITAQEGWWLDPESVVQLNPQLYPCPTGYCLDGSQCDQYRSGRLCAQCQPGFSEWNNQCQDCRTNTSPGWMAFPLGLGIVWAALLIRFPRLTETGIPKSLVFFIQSSSILLQTDKRLSAQTFLQTFNMAFDWIINLNYGGRCVMYLTSLQKITYSFYAPATPLIGIFVSWSSMKLYYFAIGRKMPSYWGWRIMAALIWSLLWAYIMFAKTAFNLISCTQIGNVYVLVRAPDIICGSPEHQPYQALGWVVIVTFVTGFPFICIGLLLYARKRLQTQPNYPLVKELYKSYQPSLWYYEIVLTIRKLCLTLIDVFSTQTQVQHGVSLNIFFFFILVIQYITQPFTNRLFNRAEDFLLMLLLLIAGLSLGDTMRTNYISPFDLNLTAFGFVGLGLIIISLFILALTEAGTAYLELVFKKLATRYPRLAKSINNIATASQRLSAFGSTFSVGKTQPQQNPSLGGGNPSGAVSSKGSTPSLHMRSRLESQKQAPISVASQESVNKRLGKDKTKAKHSNELLAGHIKITASMCEDHDMSSATPMMALSPSSDPQPDSEALHVELQSLLDIKQAYEERERSAATAARSLLAPTHFQKAIIDEYLQTIKLQLNKISQAVRQSSPALSQYSSILEYVEANATAPRAASMSRPASTASERQRRYESFLEAVSQIRDLLVEERDLWTEQISDLRQELEGTTQARSIQPRPAPSTQELHSLSQELAQLASVDDADEAQQTREPPRQQTLQRVSSTLIDTSEYDDDILALESLLGEPSLPLEKTKVQPIEPPETLPDTSIATNAEIGDVANPRRREGARPKLPAIRSTGSAGQQRLQRPVKPLAPLAPPAPLAPKSERSGAAFRVHRILRAAPLAGQAPPVAPPPRAADATKVTRRPPPPQLEAQ
ncbi:hypothetical protein RI367_002054 [Sorochytrium milnesiophthora]